MSRQVVRLWEGNRSNIDGFRLYVGNMRIQLRASQYSFWAPAYLQPPCGEQYEFRMTAFRGDRESLPSNTVYWRGEPCPRQVRVTFQQLQTHGLRDYETGITGRFWANGQQLHFDGAAPQPLGGEDMGMFLNNHQAYDILTLFQTIAQWERAWMGGSCPYSAPRDNRVTLSLGDNEDLTVGFHISRHKHWFGHDFSHGLCEGQRTIPAREIAPVTYQVSGDRCDMTFGVEMLSP